MRFMSFSKLTERGIETLPTRQGSSALEQELAKEGMSLKNYFWSPLGGAFDIVTMTEGDSIEQMAEVKKSMLASANVDISTFVIDVSFEKPATPNRPVYLSLGHWTTLGKQTLGSRSIPKLANELNQQSIELLGVYWVLCGSTYNFITLTHCDSLEVIGASRLEAALSGRVRTEVHVLYDGQSFTQICGALTPGEAVA